MGFRVGRVLVRVVWNWPEWALTYVRWRYTPDIDDRRWFMRVRVGPWKIEAVAW